MITQACHLSLCLVLLVSQTEIRKPSFRDKPVSTLGFVRCTARPTDRRTDGNLVSVINLVRHLTLSIVMLVSQTDRQTEWHLSSVISLVFCIVLCIVRASGTPNGKV